MHLDGCHISEPERPSSDVDATDEPDTILPQSIQGSITAKETTADYISSRAQAAERVDKMACNAGTSVNAEAK